MRQSTSQSRNLSSPNRIGATVKPTRSSQKAWAAGSARVVEALVAVGLTAGAGWVTVAMSEPPLLVKKLNFRVPFGISSNFFRFRLLPVRREDRNTVVAGIATLDQPLRRDLYDLLVERDDWVGRDEAAGALGIARSVAAFHLDKLAESGLVETRAERPPGRSGPGAGRPAKQSRRSDREVAVSLPDRSYGLAGQLLADAVADAEATGQPVDVTLRDAARSAGRAMGEEAR